MLTSDVVNMSHENVFKSKVTGMAKTDFSNLLSILRLPGINTGKTMARISNIKNIGTMNKPGIVIKNAISTPIVVCFFLIFIELR